MEQLLDGSPRLSGSSGIPQYISDLAGTTGAMSPTGAGHSGMDSFVGPTSLAVVGRDIVGTGHVLSGTRISTGHSHGRRGKDSVGEEARGMYDTPQRREPRGPPSHVEPARSERV